MFLICNSSNDSRNRKRRLNDRRPLQGKAAEFHGLRPSLQVDFGVLSETIEPQTADHGAATNRRVSRLSEVSGRSLIRTPHSSRYSSV